MVYSMLPLSCESSHRQTTCTQMCRNKQTTSQVCPTDGSLQTPDVNHAIFLTNFVFSLIKHSGLDESTGDWLKGQGKVDKTNTHQDGSFQ